MNESKWEPPAEVVEAMAKELHEVGYRAYGADYPYRDASPSWMSMMRAEARFVLRRQHERERGLLEAMRAAMEYLPAFPSTAGARLADALAAHAKLDAPKEDPIVNLRGAVDQIERECPGRVIATLKDSQAWQVIQIAARGKAAVEREERR